MTQITKREVLEALARVIDPDGATTWSALGMVTGVVVHGGNVGFAIEVEPSAAPARNRCARPPSRRWWRCRGCCR